MSSVETMVHSLSQFNAMKTNHVLLFVAGVFFSAFSSTAPTIPSVSSRKRPTPLAMSSVVAPGAGPPRPSPRRPLPLDHFGSSKSAESGHSECHSASAESVTSCLSSLCWSLSTVERDQQRLDASAGASAMVGAMQSKPHGRAGWPGRRGGRGRPLLLAGGSLVAASGAGVPSARTSSASGGSGSITTQQNSPTKHNSPIAGTAGALVEMISPHKGSLLVRASAAPGRTDLVESSAGAALSKSSFTSWSISGDDEEDEDQGTGRERRQQPDREERQETEEESSDAEDSSSPSGCSWAEVLLLSGYRRSLPGSRLGRFGRGRVVGQLGEASAGGHDRTSLMSDRHEEQRGRSASSSLPPLATSREAQGPSRRDVVVARSSCAPGALSARESIRAGAGRISGVNSRYEQSFSTPSASRPPSPLLPPPGGGGSGSSGAQVLSRPGSSWDQHSRPPLHPNTPPTTGAGGPAPARPAHPSPVATTLVEQPASSTSTTEPADHGTASSILDAPAPLDVPRIAASLLRFNAEFLQSASILESKICADMDRFPDLIKLQVLRVDGVEPKESERISALLGSLGKGSSHKEGRGPAGGSGPRRRLSGRSLDILAFRGRKHGFCDKTITDCCTTTTAPLFFVSVPCGQTFSQQRRADFVHEFLVCPIVLCSFID